MDGELLQGARATPAFYARFIPRAVSSGHRRRKIRAVALTLFLRCEMLNLGDAEDRAATRRFCDAYKASLHNAARIVVIIGTPFILGDYRRILRGINFTTGGSDRAVKPMCRVAVVVVVRSKSGLCGKLLSILIALPIIERARV